MVELQTPNTYNADRFFGPENC